MPSRRVQVYRPAYARRKVRESPVCLQSGFELMVAIRNVRFSAHCGLGPTLREVRFVPRVGNQLIR